MKIKDLLEPQDDKWASIVANLPTTYHDTEEEAGQATEDRIAVIGDPDTQGMVKRLACYRLKPQQMMVLIDPEDKDNNLQLGRTILQQLGAFATKVSVVMKGKPTVVPSRAKTQKARPKPPPRADVTWGRGK